MFACRYCNPLHEEDACRSFIAAAQECYSTTLCACLELQRHNWSPTPQLLSAPSQQLLDRCPQCCWNVQCQMQQALISNAGTLAALKHPYCQPFLFHSTTYRIWLQHQVYPCTREGVELSCQHDNAHCMCGYMLSC